GVMGKPEDVGHVVVRASAPADNEHAVAAEFGGERGRAATAFREFFCRDHGHRLLHPVVLLCHQSAMPHQRIAESAYVLAARWSWSISTYSLVMCATETSPGPQTTVGIPASHKKVASEPARNPLTGAVLPVTSWYASPTVLTSGCC